METRKIVSLPAELARAIEDYRFNNRLKTEAEATRRLIEAGLQAGDKIPVRKPRPSLSGADAEKPASRRSAIRRAEPR